MIHFRIQELPGIRDIEDTFQHMSPTCKSITLNDIKQARVMINI